MWLKSKKNEKCFKTEHNKIKASQPMDTLVGPNTKITGDIIFTGGLHVDGDINGQVSSEPEALSLLVVGNSARIKGDVKVQRAVVNGSIYGNLYVYDHLELGEKAVIMGDVHYNLIEMAVGSEIRGSLIPDIKKEPRSLLEDHSSRKKEKVKDTYTGGDI